MARPMIIAGNHRLNRSFRRIDRIDCESVFVGIAIVSVSYRAIAKRDREFGDGRVDGAVSGQSDHGTPPRG